MIDLRRLTLLIVPFALVAASSPLRAQSAQVGVIAGDVTDPTGGLLPGVMITATSKERGFTRTTTSDATGHFLLPVMPIGLYKLTAEHIGFKTMSLTDNLVETEKTTDVRIKMDVATVEAQVSVVGVTPIVDMTNVSVNTRVRADEFEKLAIGRSYQSLMGLVPGVVGTGNVNSRGALTSDNLFLFDGVDNTDPTTGTFGSNLNFEAIQEMSVYTAGASAEFGRAVGAVVNVITKSGTNRFEGSAKFLMSNDNWNTQNSTKSETTGASLERVKFDHVNKTYNGALGGPIRLNQAWFFAAYEGAKTTTAARQTVGQIPEDFQQTTESPFAIFRVTTQLANNHTLWVKYHRSPTDGFITDYWTNAAGERKALTAQDQGSTSTAVQWSGILAPNWTGEAMFARNTNFINVVPFQPGELTAGAPHFSLADRKYYNGATYDGSVNRPRKQFTAATTYYTTAGASTHSVKGGFDLQSVESSNFFKYPNSQLYIDNSFDQLARTFSPLSRQDYDAGASTSAGKTYSLYARDKFTLGHRVGAEVGLRYERQTGTSDVGAVTLAANTVAPRLSASYALDGAGRTLIVGSYGRLYQGVIQDLADNFAGIPQQSNYNNYNWNGTAYVFSNRVEQGASTFKPNTDLKPMHIDEETIGFQRQFGRTLGVGVRGTFRQYNDLIDDLEYFSATGDVLRAITNYGPATRTYKGLEFTFDKRLSNHWNANGSYVYARTTGNQFSALFTGLGDFVDDRCRTTVDLSIGTNGILPCGEVNDGPTKNGNPPYDRPHDLKLSGAYTRPLGRVNVTGALVSEWRSKTTFQQQRTVNVLLPGTTTNAGPTYTYFYEPRGAERIEGVDWSMDGAFEVTFKPYSTSEVGVKGEIFNFTNQEGKINLNNTVWCNADSNATCSTARSVFGTATARGSFQAPRTYRLSLLVRF